jgi:hypothetical protein
MKPVTSRFLERIVRSLYDNSGNTMNETSTFDLSNATGKIRTMASRH